MGGRLGMGEAHGMRTEFKGREGAVSKAAYRIHGGLSALIHA